MSNAKDLYVLGFAVGAGLMVASYCIIALYSLGYQEGMNHYITRRLVKKDNVLAFPFRHNPAPPEPPKND